MTMRIDVLGRVQVVRQSEVVQVPAGKLSTLLGLLAIRPEKRYAREELIECIWPDTEPLSGHNRL